MSAHGTHARTRHGRRRPWSSAVRTCVVAVLGIAATLVAGPSTPAVAAGPTIVSLTFDDGQSSQYNALPILQSHGMRGTFYVNSGLVGQAGTYYMNWNQIHQVADAGNEIGGHTLNHTNLTNVSTSTATTEVCQDRTNLINQGFNPISFAYPEAAYNTTVEGIVRQCGYSSARTVGGVNNAETIPPPDPFRVRTPRPADSGMTVQDFQNIVTGAENGGGGWVVLTFHGTCEDLQCTGGSSTKLSTLNSLLDWLQTRSANGTVVRTVGEVMGGTTPPTGTAPTTTIRCNAAACATTQYANPVSVTLAATDPENDATTTYYTTDGSAPTTASTVYTGAFTVSQTATVRYFSRDATGLSEVPRSQTITVAGSPPPPATTIVSLTFDDGQSSHINTLPILQSHNMTGTFYINSALVGSGGYYMSWNQIHQIADAGNEIGGHTLNHTDLTTVNASTATTEVCQDRTNLVNQGFNPVSFAYPYAAANATAESIVQQCGYRSGRLVTGVGTVETIPPPDPYGLRTPEPADSSTGLAGLQQGVLDVENSGGGWAIMTFHGVCNDSCTGGSSISLATFTSFLDWLQARQANGTAVRTVGQVMGPGTPAAPTTSISCNNAACASTAYASPVTVRLAANDPNGDTTTTWYTTDGSDPTTSATRTSYSGAFTVSQTRTVRYYSVDSTGRAETPKSQTINVAAAAAPTTTITCNNAACAGTTYTSAVTVRLAATDPNGDTTTTYYTVDGSDPTTSATRVTYSAAFTVDQTRTVRYYSTDSTGQSETPKSQTINVNAGSAPTTTIACNGAACATTAYPSAVTVTLAATDPNGDAVTTYYTTNGTAPTTSSPTYTGPFTVSTTSTVRFFSRDATGLSETAKSQTITVAAGSPPTTTITCNNGSCANWLRTTPVTVRLAATDPDGGTLTTYYTTDGSAPTTSSTRYTGPFTVAQTTTVRFFSVDSTARSETPKTPAGADRRRGTQRRDHLAGAGIVLRPGHPGHGDRVGDGPRHRRRCGVRHRPGRVLRQRHPDRDRDDADRGQLLVQLERPSRGVAHADGGGVRRRRQLHDVGGGDGDRHPALTPGRPLTPLPVTDREGRSVSGAGRGGLVT